MPWPFTAASSWSAVRRRAVRRPRAAPWPRPGPYDAYFASPSAVEDDYRRLSGRPRRAELRDPQ